MDEQQKTYSISIRVRRTTYEDAYIGVPVTSAITKQIEDGTFRIDTERLTSEAIRISKDDRVEWRIETCETTLHPMQKQRPDDRTNFDAFYADSDPD